MVILEIESRQNAGRKGAGPGNVVDLASFRAARGAPKKVLRIRGGFGALARPPVYQPSLPPGVGPTCLMT